MIQLPHPHMDYWKGGQSPAQITVNRNLNEDHIFEHLKGQRFPIFKRCFSYSYWQNLPLAKVINNENFLLQYYIFSFLIMSLILQVSLSRFYSPHTYTPKIQTPTQKSIL